MSRRKAPSPSEPVLKNDATSSATSASNTGMLQSAQQIITSAVNILEGEIAAGIIAAKKIEKKVLGSSQRLQEENGEAHSQQAALLMSRLRRDAHDALDLFIDGFSTLMNQIGLLNEMLPNTEDLQAAAQKSNKQLPVIELPYARAVNAGEALNWELQLSEDGWPSGTPLRWMHNGFVGPDKRLAQDKLLHINPAVFTLKPKEPLTIKMNLQLPKNCVAGDYSALLTLPSSIAPKVLLSFTVI